MKKFLFGILTFLGIGLSFCSSQFYNIPSDNGSVYLGSYIDGIYNIIPTFENSVKIIIDDGYGVLLNSFDSYNFYLFDSSFNQISVYDSDSPYFFIPSGTYYINVSGSVSGTPNTTYGYQKIHNFSHFSVVLPDEQYFPIFNFFSTFYYNVVKYSLSFGGSSISDIDVYYNNGNSVETITCDGTQAIDIRGLSTITSTNTFTPYYNISYTDEDNQKLTESYSKNILYLSGGLFKKTYTGDNERILTDTIGSPNFSFSGYLPTFEITGSVDPNDEFTGNVFNNFADNSLKYLLSNVPSYIQYFIILLILFLILGFVKKFKRK